MNALLLVLYFVLTLVFNLLIYTLWIRIGLRYLRFSALHPVSQVIYTLTNPFVNPVQYFFPKTEKRPSKFDWAAGIVLLIVEFLKFGLIGFLFYTPMFPLLYILAFMVADLLVQPLNLLFYMILIRVIMSWVQPDWRHPVNDVLSAFTNPVLRLGQSFIPPISGFDFAPLIVLLIIKVLTLFISASLPIHLF